MHVSNILVGSDAGIRPSLSNRSKLRAHHRASKRSGGERGHVANAMSFGKSAKSRRCRAADKGADVAETQKRVDLHCVFGFSCCKEWKM